MTSLSRTSYYQFFPSGYANTFASENREAEEKLRTVEERIKRGHDKSLAKFALVSQRAKEAGRNVPCIEDLRKRKEDHAHSTWEQYLIKHNGIKKKQESLEKAQRAAERDRARRNEQHLSHIRQKIRFNTLEQKEKHRQINKKFESIDKKIEESKERKRLFTLKHRELESLKMDDFREIRNSHKNKGFKEKCDIVEKHIGMSITLNEKR